MKRLALLLLIICAGCLKLPSCDDYRAEGAKAERLGLNAEANPYSHGSPPRYYWHEGYMEGREKRWKQSGLSTE